MATARPNRDDSRSCAFPGTFAAPRAGRIALEEQGTDTVLHLHQELFETQDGRDRHQGGWTSTLERLAELRESEGG